MAEEKKSEKFTFKGWNWKKLIIGAKRPAIALIGVGLTYLATKPQWYWLAAGGITAERIWATIEFYFQA